MRASSSCLIGPHTSILFFLALVQVLQPKIAHAQFVDRCEFQFRPGRGSTIPGNAPGIAFERGAAAKLENLELKGPGGDVVPVQIVERFGTPQWSVMPERPLALGAHQLALDFTVPIESFECPFETGADGGTRRHIDHFFSAGPEAPLPSTLGEIVVEGPQPVDSADQGFEILLAISDAAKPYLPLLAFTLRINGQVSAVPGPDGTFPKTVGVIPKFQARIFCGVDAGGSGVVSDGDNTLRIEATLPGRDNTLSTETIATLTCNAPPKLRPPGTPASPRASEATVSACGCKLPGTSSSSSTNATLLTIPFVALTTAWLLRRRVRK